MEAMKPLALALAGLVALLATGCSGDTAASGSLGPATAESDDGWPFVVEEVDRLDAPWAMAFLPGTGDLLITERTGALHLRDAGSGERVEVGGVPEVVVAGQGGLETGDRQFQDPAQDTTNTLGTIVRLTPDGDPAPGNPLADEGGVTAEIWSWGHRNPLGLEIAPDGTLWSSEMGPEGGDELNLVEAGSNYGWPEASDGSDYGGGEIPDHAEGDGYAPPARSWTPSISPGSLMIYRGDLFEDWQGDAFLGALSGEALVRVDLDGETAGDAEVFDTGERIRAVEEGPDGSIWLLEDAGAGRLLRLTPAE